MEAAQPIDHAGDGVIDIRHKALESDGRMSAYVSLSWRYAK